ncbi:MAG: hypothetical protein ACK4NC_03250 [Candidatus Gracilibacteria bacterium]
MDALIQNKILACDFLSDTQKQYFIMKLPTLTEEGKQEIEKFLQDALVRYHEEEKILEEKYTKELQKINEEVDHDFLMAKRLIESSMIQENEKEETALLNQL